MTGLLLVDTSVWQRWAREPAIAEALYLAGASRIALCLPIALELGYSAQSVINWQEIRNRLDGFRMLPFNDNVSFAAQEIQYRLWENGMGRAVGAMDLLIAAIALPNNATVVHYDSDFEFIANAIPEFKQRMGGAKRLCCMTLD